VIGKLSQMDFLCALEPRDANLDQIRQIQTVRFHPQSRCPATGRVPEKFPPILDVYSKASKMKVTDYMQRPTEGEYVDETLLWIWPCIS
jgi:hypothetical protein